MAAHGSIAVLHGTNWLAFGKRSWGKRSPSFDQNTIHHRCVRVIHRDRDALGVAWERMALTTEKDRARRWNGPGRDVSVLLLVTNRARLRSPFARPSHLRKSLRGKSRPFLPGSARRSAPASSPCWSTGWPLPGPYWTGSRPSPRSRRPFRPWAKGS